jgi:hypothetical protein
VAVKRNPRTYKREVHQVRLYREDIVEVWNLLEGLGKGEVDAAIETKSDGRLEITASEDLETLTPSRFVEMRIRCSAGVEVVLRRREAFVQADEPSNEEIGVITNVVHALSRHTAPGAFLAGYLLISASMIAGATFSQRLENPWKSFAFWLSLAVPVIALYLMIRLRRESAVINKPRAESFFARTRDDFIVNGIFAIVGGVIGFIVGRV